MSSLSRGKLISLTPDSWGRCGVCGVVVPLPCVACAARLARAMNRHPRLDPPADLGVDLNEGDAERYAEEVRRIHTRGRDTRSGIRLYTKSIVQGTAVFRPR